MKYPPLICDASLLKIDLKGRVYIVTGANSGIGFVTAEQLVKQGAFVIMACRNTQAAESAVAKIFQENPQVADNQLMFIPLDLASLTSVREFVSTFKKRFDHLDGLVNNAGGAFPKLTHTTEGFESSFGVNHLGPFLLTQLLLPPLLRSSAPRVVNVASASHDTNMHRGGCFYRLR